MVGFSLCCLSATAQKLQLNLEAVISKGLSEPIQAIPVPGTSDHLYVVQQGGKILVWDGKRLQKDPLLEIAVTTGAELGLLGMALHPEFDKKSSPHYQRYFVNYNLGSVWKQDLRTVIGDCRVGKKTCDDLLVFSQPFPNHNGGQLLFGPDGYLYIGTGDGGAAGDPYRNSQNLGTLLGKILRIDVNQKKGYGIPSDNPFQKSDQKKEIYAYGLRNPWRFAFDRENGKLFAADVGQNLWEEVHLIEKGGNYGWNQMEGSHCFPPSAVCDKKAYALPIFEYPRNEGICIIGGVVYRGKRIPELSGAYLLSDYYSGTVWALQKNGSWKASKLLENKREISSFAEDAQGEVLVVFHSGSVQRLVKVPATGK